MIDLKIWITGAKGKIGNALVHYFNHDGYTVLATDKEVDITDYDVISHYALRHRPDVIINCAALTGFERCKEQELEAYRINALGARNAAMAAQSIRAKIIQISSDDVFTSYKHHAKNEFDFPKPMTVYGKSKLAGETFVRELNPKHIILRSSWIYNANEEDFLYQIISNTHNEIPTKVCSKQFSSPTSIDAFCKALSAIILSNEYGIFHASCEGVCSRLDFAKKVVELLGISDQYLEDDEYVTIGQDGYTVLENLMLKMTNIYTMLPWQEELSNYILEHRGEWNEE